MKQKRKDRKQATNDYFDHIKGVVNVWIRKDVNKYKISLDV